MDNDKSLRDEYKYKVIDTIGEQAWNGLMTYYKLRFKELDNEVSRKVLLDTYGQTFEEYCEDELMADLSSGMNVPKIEMGASIYDSAYRKSKKEADILRQEARGSPEITDENTVEKEYTKFSKAKIKWRQFPEESRLGGSDANRYSIWWAYREDVEVGAQRIVNVGNEHYLIEKFESEPSKYLMIEKLTNREYLSMKEDFENEKLFTTKSLVESNGESSWSGIEHGGRRPSANINASEFGQENRNVSGVDSDKVRGRRTENYSNRSNESYSEDKQNVKKFSKSIDSEGNTLTEAQAQYFKDSKVRDENGNLLVVYHGTEEKFFTFDIGKGGKNGRALGYGFYFTPDKTMAESFGDNIIKSYLNVKRFMSNDKKTIKKTEFKNFVKTLLEKDLETYSDEGITWQDSFLSNYFYTYDYSKKDAINKFVDIVWNENNNDIDLLFEVAIADGLNSSTQGARRFYDVLKESTGYDGIMQGNEIVVFNSNQIKSIDNINPTDDKDIRYSKSSNAIYTEKQYNDYGWARADDILLMNENEVLKKKALKDDRIKLSNNEYAIVVGKKYGIGNKVVITNSSKTNPKILRVIAVNIDGADFDVESYLPELRRYIYDQEQDRDRLWTSYEVLNLYAEAEVLRSYSKEDCPSYSEYRKSRQNDKGTFPNGRENERKRIIKFSKSIDQRYLELAKNLEVNREEL